MTYSESTRGLLERLREALERTAPQKRLAIAYSGGLDSRFLSHASKLLGFTPLLLHVTGAHAGGDEELACRWAHEQGFRLKVLEVDPLGVPEVAQGTKYRCYGCKKAVFTALLREAEGLPLCDGTNHTDGMAGVWRPGMKALKELGIASPLAMAGLGKPEIRAVARETGMERPDQLPEPCMLTRLPYGMTPTEPVLLKLREAETLIARVLAPMGVSGMTYRLRLVAPGRPELHFSMDAWVKLTEEQREEIRSRVAQAFPEDFSALALRGLEKLSGYYDRVSGNV